MKRGPKVGVLRVASKTETRFSLMLSCGHNADRPVKRRITPGIGESEKDPAPIWVYCELCRDGVEVGT